MSKEILEKFTRQNQSLEALNLPKNQLVFSAKTLGLVSPDHFQSMMNTVLASIEPGGYFVGNFFGEMCNANIQMIKLSEQDIRELFKDFIIIEIEPRDRVIPVKLRDNAQEHRHLRDIIAQKK